MMLKIQVDHIINYILLCIYIENNLLILLYFNQINAALASIKVKKTAKLFNSSAYINVQKYSFTETI